MGSLGRRGTAGEERGPGSHHCLTLISGCVRDVVDVDLSLAVLSHVLGGQVTLQC